MHAITALLPLTYVQCGTTRFHNACVDDQILYPCILYRRKAHRGSCFQNGHSSISGTSSLETGDLPPPLPNPK
eukprot:6454727-Amphidinium_carterae.1